MRNVRLHIAFVVLCLGALCSMPMSAASSKKRVPTIIKQWHLQDDYSVPDTTRMDTSFLNLPMKEMPHTYSIANAYNGNFVSPLQSKIYFDRQKKIDFIFADAYTPYILTMGDVNFYNSTTPYSTIAYKRGFTTYREEHDLDFFFTGNINRRVNLGIGLNYLNGVGHYEFQAGKRFAGQVFGSYNGNHYSFQGGVVFNSLSNQENGGITTPDELGGSLKSYDLNYSMEGMSGLKHISAFFNHYYSIAVERERIEQLPEPRGGWKEGDKQDTLIIDYIPVTTFKHTFEFNRTSKRYAEQSSQTAFYDTAYYHSAYTRDSASVLNIRNTLSVTFEEEFNKWLKFGATVFATNEFERYGYMGGDRTAPFETSFPANLSVYGKNPTFLVTDTTKLHQWTNNTWVGASLYKNQGKWIKYGFSGDVCLAGYKLGEFSLNGHINGEFPIGKDTMLLVAKAYLKNEEPNYFLQHYNSNHYRWDNDFGKIYRFYVGGTVSYPTKYVQPAVNVGFENLTRYIYFSTDGLPHQTDANIQVLSVDARINILTKRFGMENDIVYQMSSSAYLPLPMLSLYHNIYYHDWWFHRAMGAQIGVDMRYHTAYYAPLLNPATGQFMVQQTEKVGNYPILNVYANFYVRALKLKFFAQFTHFNYYFMKNKTYFSMPTYPLNPPVFRAGLAWHFYN